MNFFKENSYDIVKLYLTQIAISVFALIMYTSAGFIQANTSLSATFQIIISVFSILFYYVLLYTAAWDWGANDKIRADSGRCTLDKTRALKMIAISNIPNYIFVIVPIIGYGLSTAGVETFLVKVGTVFFTILRFTASMFQGVVVNVFDFLRSDAEGATNISFYLALACGYAVMILVTIAVTHCAYAFGSRDKKLFGFIKTNKKYE
jgi:hypothetical protein